MAGRGSQQTAHDLQNAVYVHRGHRHGEQVRQRREITWFVATAVVAGALGIVVPSPASGSCVGPLLRVGPILSTSPTHQRPELLQHGQAVTVTGEWFHSGCADTYSNGPGCSGSSARPDDPEAPLTNVKLTLHQRSKTWVLGSADAIGERYSISWTWQLPSGVEPGPAELRAESATLTVAIGS